MRRILLTVIGLSALVALCGCEGVGRAMWSVSCASPLRQGRDTMTDAECVNKNMMLQASSNALLLQGFAAGLSAPVYYRRPLVVHHHHAPRHAEHARP